MSDPDQFSSSGKYKSIAKESLIFPISHLDGLVVKAFVCCIGGSVFDPRLEDPILPETYISKYQITGCRLVQMFNW